MNNHYSSLKHVTSACLYTTPQAVAELMVYRPKIKLTDKVLEACAGRGTIAREIRKKKPASLTVCEMNAENRQLLISSGFDIQESDFFRLGEEHLFDQILMNPPLKRDIDFINKGIKHLKPRGCLKALIHTQTALTPEYNSLLKRRDIRMVANQLASFYFDNQFSAILIKIEKEWVPEEEKDGLAIKDISIGFLLKKLNGEEMFLSNETVKELYERTQK